MAGWQQSCASRHWFPPFTHACCCRCPPAGPFLHLIPAVETLCELGTQLPDGFKSPEFGKLAHVLCWLLTHTGSTALHAGAGSLLCTCCAVSPHLLAVSCKVCLQKFCAGCWHALLAGFKCSCTRVLQYFAPGEVVWALKCPCVFVLTMSTLLWSLQPNFALAGASSGP